MNTSRRAQEQHIAAVIKSDISQQAHALYELGTTVEMFDLRVATMAMSPYMRKKAEAIRTELLRHIANAAFNT